MNILMGQIVCMNKSVINRLYVLGWKYSQALQALMDRIEWPLKVSYGVCTVSTFVVVEIHKIFLFSSSGTGHLSDVYDW